MNPKQFLTWAGIILVLVAILGWIHVLGPTSDRSLFGGAWYFDNGENWAHLILGVVALAAAYGLKDPGTQRMLVILVGLLAVIVGLIGFFLSKTPPNFLGANLENPLDNILHLVIGAWALWAAFGKGTSSAAPTV